MYTWIIHSNSITLDLYFKEVQTRESIQVEFAQPNISILITIYF